MRVASFLLLGLQLVRDRRAALSRSLAALQAQRLAEQRLREANEGLEKTVGERTARLSLLLAKLSHEFRTPLASIRGYAETLRRGAIDDRENRLEFLAIIEKSSLELSDAVDQLVEFSRRALKHPAGPPERVEVAAAVDDILAGLNPIAERKGVALSSHVPSGLALRARRGDLLTALRNLCANAIKYNRPGGTVCVGGRVQGGLVLVAVQDDGLGIPSADLPKIFDPFYRASSHRAKASGSGLGLSIVKDAMEASGGSVRVESVEDRGTTFTLAFPAA